MNLRSIGLVLVLTGGFNTSVGGRAWASETEPAQAAAVTAASQEDTNADAVPVDNKAGRAGKTATDKPSATEAEAEAETKTQELFRGQVVNVQEALKRRGLAAYDEFKQQYALETPAGELLPIIPDWRGRAFYQDKRLRNRRVELVGFRRPGIPYIQVITIFTFNKEGERQYMDYWCEICSIPMYEIKPCDCCQGDIEIRFQPRDLPDFLNDSAR